MGEVKSEPKTIIESCEAFRAAAMDLFRESGFPAAVDRLFVWWQNAFRR